MPSFHQLRKLLSQYELLEWTTKHLSTLDLLHLAATCSEFYNLIRKSEPIFNRLRASCLCDGHGLKARQDFRGLFASRPPDPAYGIPHFARYDEEVEVRVWNIKCDAANGLPCLRCGVNVCEECRYMPRIRDGEGFRSRRRPHLEPARQLHDIVCYCVLCDKSVEHHLPFRLSEFCDCDQYTRWICLPCKTKEEVPNKTYFRTRTKGALAWGDDVVDGGMWLIDHQDDRAFWCPCGERAPQYGNVRCAWCLRRHNLETWKDEDPRSIPVFDSDPCYPKVIPTPRFSSPTPWETSVYPDLGYTGPIAP